MYYQNAPVRTHFNNSVSFKSTLTSPLTGKSKVPCGKVLARTTVKSWMVFTGIFNAVWPNLFLPVKIDKNYLACANLDENDVHIIKWSEQTQRRMRPRQDHGERQKCPKDCLLDFQIFLKDLNAFQSVLWLSMRWEIRETPLWIHNMLNIN